MALILTFLGKGGTGRTTVAIAAAKRLAAQGQRVLLVAQEAGQTLGLLLKAAIGTTPTEISANFQVVQLQTTALLERSWEDLKEQEAQYLRTPFLKSVYGQELGILPGMDNALALNALREFDASDRYDVILYDGSDDQATLRMLGMPEILNWYLRRFRNVFEKSDLGSVLTPFFQPILSAVLNVGMSGDHVAQPTNRAKDLLEQGQAAITNPARAAAYLVTSSDALAIAKARYLWGCAQQVGLTVGGVILNHPHAESQQVAVEMLAENSFKPLPVSLLPFRLDEHWEPLMAALPSFQEALQAPRPIIIDVHQKLVKLFLPGFDKKQVNLIQSGPEITIEAGDQRRNLFLPPELSGRSATGAKFQDDYLTIFL
jgi:arsenite-transporting ATPase